MGQRIANERRARSQRRAAHMPIDLPIDCDWFDVQEKDYGPAARLSKTVSGIYRLEPRASVGIEDHLFARRQ
jgi:hypothetical protein